MNLLINGIIHGTTKIHNYDKVCDLAEYYIHFLNNSSSGGDENTGEAIEQPRCHNGSNFVICYGFLHWAQCFHPSRNARLNNCDAGKICNVYQFLLCYLGRNGLKGQSLFTVEAKCLYAILSGCFYTANTFLPLSTNYNVTCLSLTGFSTT